MKKLLLIGMLLFLSACAIDKPRETTVYVDKPVPFYIVPYPSNITRPDFEINKIDKDNYKPGEVSKAFRITMKQYEQYVALLEEVIDKYRQLAEKSKDKLKDLQDATSAEKQSVPNPTISNRNSDSFIESNLQHMLELYSTEQEFKQIESKSQKEKVEIE